MILNMLFSTIPLSDGETSQAHLLFDAIHDQMDHQVDQILYRLRDLSSDIGNREVTEAYECIREIEEVYKASSSMLYELVTEIIVFATQEAHKTNKSVINHKITRAERVINGASAELNRLHTERNRQIVLSQQQQSNTVDGNA